MEETWAYNNTWKATIGFTPFGLVYGKKALLSIVFDHNTLRIAAQLDLNLTMTQHERLLQLNGLDESRMKSLLHTKVIQLQRKMWHDNHTRERGLDENLHEAFEANFWVENLFDEIHDKKRKKKIKIKYL